MDNRFKPKSPKRILEEVSKREMMNNYAVDVIEKFEKELHEMGIGTVCDVEVWLEGNWDDSLNMTCAPGVNGMSQEYVLGVVSTMVDDWNANPEAPINLELVEDERGEYEFIVSPIKQH